jgi:hypothetical protein
MKKVAKEGILLTYGKLTMECCEKVPAEREEQPGEDERDYERGRYSLHMLNLP